MRRVLFIAYYFPPSPAVGRVRSAKFCKHLLQFGYQGVVLTRDAEGEQDPESLAEIPPQVEVHRVAQSDVLGRVQGTLRWVRSLAGSWRSSAGSAGTAAAPPGNGQPKGRLSHALCWPDFEALWIPPATRKALALARSCQAIFSTGSPWSSQLVALQVHRLTGLPWIMDFRDPWMQGGSIHYPLGAQRKLFAEVEAKCVAHCDRLINVTPPLTERYRQAYPHEPSEKFVTIPNGYDPEDFANLPAPPSDGPLIMTYVGTLFCGRTSLPLMQALALLRREGRLPPGALRVQLVGTGNQSEQDEAAKASLSDTMIFLPQMPYVQAIRVLARSHVAMLIGGPKFDAVSMPTKLFEYFGMKKPILAMLPDGPLRDLLSAGGTVCVPDDHPQEIARAISGMLDQFRKGQPLAAPTPPPIIQSATRQANAAALAEELDQVLHLCERGG